MSFFDQVEDFEDLFPDPQANAHGTRIYPKLVVNSADYDGPIDWPRSIVGDGSDLIMAFDPGFPAGVSMLHMEPGKTYTILGEQVILPEYAQANIHAMLQFYYANGTLSPEEFIAEMRATNVSNFLGMTRKEVIEHEIARLQKEHAELSQFGEDEFDAYTILRISMQYDHEKPNATVYRYAAIKIGNVWYTTASTNRGNQFMWADLVMWMRPHVVKIEIMNSSTVLFDKDAKIIEASPETEEGFPDEETRSGLDVQ